MNVQSAPRNKSSSTPCCFYLILFLSIFLGVLYAGLLLPIFQHLGVLQWVDNLNPAGRGLRWHGETPWLLPGYPDRKKMMNFDFDKIPDLSGGNSNGRNGTNGQRQWGGNTNSNDSSSNGANGHSGEIILITGGNSGLGFWTAVNLARYGRPKAIILGCRSMRKCEKAAWKIREEVWLFDRRKGQGGSNDNGEGGEHGGGSKNLNGGDKAYPLQEVYSKWRSRGVERKNAASIKKHVEESADRMNQNHTHGQADRHRQTAPTQILPMELDLASFTSIRNFAKRFQERFQYLNSLILNAGVMLVPEFQKTVDGFEKTMQSNHLGHFLLTALLQDNLERAARDDNLNFGVATVSVHSSAAIFEPSGEPGGIGIRDEYLLKQVEKEDSPRTSWYDSFEAYRQSKLANVLFAQELGKRFAARKRDGMGHVGQVLVNAHAPGAVRTNLLSHILGEVGKDGPVLSSSRENAAGILGLQQRQRENNHNVNNVNDNDSLYEDGDNSNPSGEPVPPLLDQFLTPYGRYLLLKYIFPIHRVIWDPEDASLTQIYTAVGDEIRGKNVHNHGPVTGKFFQSVARMVEPDPHCRNDTLQKWLWKRSEDAVGVEFG